MAGRLVWGAAATALVIGGGAFAAATLSGGRASQSVLAAGALAPSGIASSAGATRAASARTDGPIVIYPSNFDVSPRMRDVPNPPPHSGPPIPAPRAEPEEPTAIVGSPPPGFVDPLLQRTELTGRRTPALLTSFEGISNEANNILSGHVWMPPDVEGDVGLNHYVEFVNQAWAVFSKGGTPVFGWPKANKAIWSGFANTACANDPNGDPIVVYDRFADRWLLNEFALPNGPSAPPYFQCIAVSTSGDPTGSYNRYAYQFSEFPDYAKIGAWPDAYYMSFNQFPSVRSGVAAFDRAAMIAGNPSAAMVYFDLNGSPGVPLVGIGLLPSDLDGGVLPPAGEPNFFIRFVDAGNNSHDRLELFKFHVDFATPSNSTFTGPTNISVPAFDSNLCARGPTFDPCIPQPGIANRVDAISDRLMSRLAYRRFLGASPHESLVLNHTVDTDTSDHAGVRWYELRDPDGSPSVFQAGTWAPDAEHRWMGSIAMDKAGDIALGYSVSGTVVPSIRYAARTPADPPGDLGSEVTLQAGMGSQLTGRRWGDYTAMQVDPSDDCTFFYVNEYYGFALFNDNNYNWHTRIGSFKFDACSAPPTSVAVTGFATRRSGSSMTLAWRTATESQIGGFNVYRNRDRLNTRLIISKHAGQARGASYSFVDAKPVRGAHYRLQVVLRSGEHVWFRG